MLKPWGYPPQTPTRGQCPWTPSFVACGCVMVIIFFKKTAQSAVFDKVFAPLFSKSGQGCGDGVPVVLLTLIQNTR